MNTETSNNASALVIRGTDLEALSDDPDDLAAELRRWPDPRPGRMAGPSLSMDSAAVVPPKDSIREIRINQNPFSPEYDKLGLAASRSSPSRDGQISREAQ